MKTHGFLSLALRQRLIKRWSLMYCTKDENVLEHSAVVALLSLIVGHIALANGKNVRLEKMLAHAILHDTPEILCQDIVQPVKHSTPSLKEEFSKLEKVCEDKLLNTLPVELKSSVEQYFHLTGYERKLVKACDIYSAYIKCRQEFDAGNHIEFKDALNKMETVIIGLCLDFPEIEQLHKWFSDGLSMSVDELLK